jgi:hypothetical protein
MGHRNLKSIERIKIDDLLKKDLTKSENYEALTAELKHPKVAQLCKYFLYKWGTG